MTPHSDPLRVTLFGCVCTAVLVFCVLAMTAPASATSSWVVVWEENFDNNRADGWKFDTCTRYDTLCLRDGKLYGCSPAEADNAGKRPPEGGVPESHGGFTATSPDLGALGLDFRQPYTIEFDYILDQHSCFTYVLASRVGLLVIDDTVGDTGYLAMVDHNHANPQRVAALEVGVSYNIKLRADPEPASGLCRYKLFVDGEMVSQGSREDCLTYTGVQVMDLPARIATDPNDLPTESACFGAGYWDNFVVKRLAFDERTGGDRGIDIGVEPSPFNPKTSVRFTLERPGHVQVSVFDVAGRMVRVLCDEPRDAGVHVVPWNGRDDRGADVASGSYLVMVRAGGGQAVTRAVLVR